MILLPECFATAVLPILELLIFPRKRPLVMSVHVRKNTILTVNTASDRVMSYYCNACGDYLSTACVPTIHVVGAPAVVVGYVRLPVSAFFVFV